MGGGGAAAGVEGKSLAWPPRGGDDPGSPSAASQARSAAESSASALFASPEGWRAKRVRVAGMLHLGLFAAFYMRANLSEAAETLQDAFGWDDATQGYVLSSFFWGYVAGQYPGALFVQRVGGKTLLLWGIACTSAMTILLPFVASRVGLVYAVRALTGFFEGATFPAVNDLFRLWLPPAERSTLVGFVMSGCYLGTAAALPVTGAIIDAADDGWRWSFYSSGIGGLLWCALWGVYGAASPRDDPRCSEAETWYIEHHIGATHAEEESGDESGGDESGGAEGGAGVAAPPRKAEGRLLPHGGVVRSPSTPYRGFVTHPAAWALYVAQFATLWNLYTLLTFLPKFLKEQLGFSVKSAGFVASLPYILQFLFSWGSGRIADAIIARGATRIFARRLFQIGFFVINAACLCGAGWLDSVPLAVAVMSIANASSGLCSPGYVTTYVEVSPHYVPMLFAIGNTLGNVAGIIAPIICGKILNSDREPDSSSGSGTEATREAWRVVFYVSAAIGIAAVPVWARLARSHPIQALN